MSRTFFCDYSVAQTHQFALYLADGTKKQASATFATGDLKRVVNGGTLTNATSLPTSEGGGIYSHANTATEATGERVTFMLSDLTASQLWLDTDWNLVTSGNASAKFQFDLHDLTPLVTVNDFVSNSITASAIQAGAIGSSEIAANAIGASQIAANAIGSSELATDAIGQDQLAAAAISSTHFAAGARDTASLDTAGKVALYQGGIWYDNAAAGTGTTIGTHGIPTSPVNAIADAITLAGSTGLRKIFFIKDASASIAGSCDKIMFEALTPLCLFTVSVNVTDCVFKGGLVGGTFGDGCRFEACSIFASTDLHCIPAINCGMDGTHILEANQVQHMIGCYAESVSSGSGMNLDFTNSTSKASVRRWSGDIEVLNMDGTNEMDLEGFGRLTVNANCTAGTITVRGDFEIVDNAGGAVTINTTAAGVNLTQIGGSAARLTRFTQILDETEQATVSGSPTATGWDASGLRSTVDGAYINRRGVFISTTGSVDRGTPFDIVGYTGAGKSLVVDPLDFAPAIGDSFLLFV